MAEDTASSIGADDAAAQRASLRKARREAKIKAGGSSRLNKITGVGGGLQRDPIPSFDAPTPSGSPAPTPFQFQAQVDDPAMSDLAQHFWAPARRAGADARDIQQPPAGPMDLDEDFFAKMMADMGGGGGDGPPMPDQLMKLIMMQAGIGGAGGAGAGGGGGGGGLGLGLNPAAGGGWPLPPQQQAAAPTAADRRARLWRAAHALLAIGLGLYVCLHTSFSGARLEREQAPELEDPEAARARWVFRLWIAVEAVLLTSRLMLLDGAAAGGFGGGGGGLLDGVLASFLPPGVGQALKIGMKYARWAMALRTDIAVVVFVLGVCAWARGGGV